MKNIIANAEKTANDLRQLTENNKEKISRTVDDFSMASNRLRNFVEKKESKFTDTADNPDKSSKKFNESGANIDSISIALKEPANNHGNGEGALGRVMKDDILYEKPLKTTTMLDSFITDLKENPEKHMYFSIF